jgi:hypothetical protein
MGDHLAGGRIEDIAEAVALAGNPFAVDEVVENRWRVTVRRMACFHYLGHGILLLTHEFRTRGAAPRELATRSLA